MAVTKSRRISSWTLLVISAITVIVLGIFYFGGINNPGEEVKDPTYTGLLLNWMYILFLVTLAATVLFAIWQFITLLRENPKSAISALIVLVAFVAMLFITYSMGDGTQLQLVGYEGEHNVSFWLKLTDMWLYSSYILTVLIIVSVIAGSIKRSLNK